MTCRPSLPLSVAILCLVLSSCSKSGSKPNTQPTDTTTVGTMNINCSIPFNGPQTELIVSEPGGKILLDTIATNGSSPIVAALKTNDTLVDVTYIEPATTAAPLANAVTFKSINLSRLSSLGINDYKDYFNYHLGNIPQSQIIYYNVPSQPNFYNYSGGIYFTNYPNNEPNGSGADPTDHSIEVTYQNYNGNYAYMLFPQAGLYNLHLQQNTVDSVDCSHLDTAVQLTFSRPVPFTEISISSTLWGILDTTDLSRAIGFTDYTQTSTKSGVDYEYAPLPMQKYEMDYYANYSNSDMVTNCPTMPIRTPSRKPYLFLKATTSPPPTRNQTTSASPFLIQALPITSSY